MTERLAQELRERFPRLEMRENAPLDRYTGFHIGGPARLLLLPGGAEELAALCAALERLGEDRPLILGNGTNVLVPDEGIDGAVIVTRRADGLRLQDGLLLADCGASLTKVAAFAAEHGLSGLEFAHGIPGTVGGAIVMNAGAYGGEMKDVAVETDFLDASLQPRTCRGEAHGFGYRTSAFDGSAVVLRTKLRLGEDDPAAIRERCRVLAEKRRASQPLELPSAGSAFKRPKEGYAAAMIDEAGLKGLSVGGAQVSEKHAGFIVNTGGATADDVRRLLELVRERVLARFGVLLEPEIKIL